MFFKFFPKDFKFVDLFEKQVQCALDGALHFKEMVIKGKMDEAAMEKMRQIEHQGDEAAHAIIEHLNKTFITPFDREDIYALTKQLDDVTDMLNTIVNRLVVYKISGVNKNLVQFASMIEDSVKSVAHAVRGLRDLKNSKSVLASCVEINRLENSGDSMRDNVLLELFTTEKDPISVIKWKEIYEDAETVLDICEDVAHVVESILVKQA